MLHIYHFGVVAWAPIWIRACVFSFGRKAIKFVEKKSKQAKSECSFQIAISKAAEARNWQRKSQGIEINREAVQTFFVGIEINIELLKHNTISKAMTIMCLVLNKNMWFLFEWVKKCQYFATNIFQVKSQKIVLIRQICIVQGSLQGPFETKLFRKGVPPTF